MISSFAFQRSSWYFPFSFSILLISTDFSFSIFLISTNFSFSNLLSSSAFSCSSFFSFTFNSVASSLLISTLLFIISKITFWLSSLKLENSLALAIVKLPFSSISFNSGIRFLFILSYLPTCVGDNFKSLAIISLIFPGTFSPFFFLVLYSSVSLFTCSSFSISVNSLVWALAWIRIISLSISFASITLQGTKANISFPC